MSEVFGMGKQLYYLLALIIASSSLLIAGNAFARDGYGENVNALCAPQTPFTGSCSLCHTSSKSAPTPAKSAYLAGGQTLINFFCPPPATPTCTDNDHDTFAKEGGACGPVDCDDSSPTVYPGAPEICGDGIDQDCNGADLACPANVVPPLMNLLKPKK